MSVPETDPANVPAAKPLRPSWETVQSPPAVPVSRPGPLKPAYSAPPSPVSAPSASYEPPPDPSGRYDLAGNLIPGSGPPAAAPPAPFIYSAGKAAPGVWPPPPVSYSGASRQQPENGTDRISRLKWNWGAFLLPFWWSIFNGQKGIAWAIVLINGAGRAIPAPYDWGLTIVSVGIMFYLGAMGHRLAWSSDRFAGDYDSFISTQRAWMIWGFIITGLIAAVIIMAAVLFPIFSGAMYSSHSGLHSRGDTGAGQ